LSSEKYRRRVAEGLDGAFQRAAHGERHLDLSSARVVLVSDLHKGARDGADDFWRCERAYHAALGHYLEDDYTLVAMGDVEELWECWPREVLRSYPDTLALEAAFCTRGRYLRLWGNHDDHWRSEAEVAKHLRPIYGNRLVVAEGLRIRVFDGDEELGLLFLVHGHQGTSASDRWAGFARVAVRSWRVVQRITKRSLNTPATSHTLRQRHDEAMFRWARGRPGREPVVLIAGHTHHPVFWESWRRHEDELEDVLLRRRQAGAPVEELRELHAELELARAEFRWRDPAPIPISPPCYFNTGCCAFADGDVTAIEIRDGQIKLVRWLNDEQRALPKVLAVADLSEVLRRVQGRPLRKRRTDRPLPEPHVERPQPEPLPDR
jgi:UDP-2,3-diacylglucosamine pyrophosphatase LpxH